MERPKEGTRNLELSVFALEVWVGFGQIGDFHLFGVPFQSFPGELTGDYTEAKRFRQRPGIVEARKGLILPFDGIQKLGIVVHSLNVGFRELLDNALGVKGGHGAMG